MVPEFSMSVIDLPGLHLVSLNGELDLATADGLPDVLAETSESTVVVDLEHLTFIDSTGFRALVVARKRIMSEQGQLLLTRPGPMIQRTFEIVGLEDWIVPWSSEWDENGSIGPVLTTLA